MIIIMIRLYRIRRKKLPLMKLGCWHYISPDYFPLHAIGDGLMWIIHGPASLASPPLATLP
jgi:hypothetical protein